MANGLRRLHWGLALFWTLLALVVLWQYDPVQRKLDADASFMLYAGQQILRGHAPYVGVTIVKLPGSPFVAATGIAAGRVLGLDDILAGRIAFWLCAGSAVGAVYLIGVSLVRALRRDTDDNWDILWQALFGSVGAVILLSFQSLGIQVAEGPEAKLPMLGAGMVCLVLVARQKFFAAGITAALSFMAWQPGLIFAVAALVGSLVVTNRRRALLATVAGIALPLLVIGGYLALNGAFGSMLRQAFGANANYLGEKKVAAGIFSVVLPNTVKVWDVSLECLATESPFVYIGYLGMLGGAAFLAYLLWHTRETKLFLVAFPLLLSGAGLFGFSLLDLQKCSDLVPLLPYLALGGAAGFAALLGLSARLLGSPRYAFALGAALLLVILFYGARDAFTHRRQTGLEQQRALARELAAQLQPEDRVQQFGDTMFLVVTGRENATRFVHLGEKQGLGILTAEGVSIEALVQQLQQENPRLVTLSRAKNKGWAQPLYTWIEANYAFGTLYTASEGGTLKETDIWWRK